MIEVINEWRWALRGLEMGVFKVGEKYDFGKDCNERLIHAGYAKHVDILEPEIKHEKQEETVFADREELKTDELSEFKEECIAEKGNRGSWTVLFRDEEYKVRAKSEEEAKEKAYSKFKGE